MRSAVTVYQKAIRAITSKPLQAFALITLLLSKTSFFAEVQGTDNDIRLLPTDANQPDMTSSLTLELHNALLKDDVVGLHNFIQQHPAEQDLYHTLWWKAAATQRSKIFNYLVSIPVIRDTIIYQDAYDMALDGNAQLLEALKSVGITAHDKFLFKILDELETYRTNPKQNLTRVKQLIIAFDLLIKNGGNRYAIREGQSLLSKALVSTNTRVIKTLLEGTYDFNHYPDDIKSYLEVFNNNDFVRFELLLQGGLNFNASHLKTNLPVFLTSLIAKYQQPNNDGCYQFLQNLQASPHSKVFLQDLKNFFPGPIDYLNSFTKPIWRPYYRVMIPLGTFVNNNLSIIMLSMIASALALFKNPRRMFIRFYNLLKLKPAMKEQDAANNVYIAPKEKKHSKMVKKIKNQRIRKRKNSKATILVSDETDSDSSCSAEDTLDIVNILKTQSVQPLKSNNKVKTNPVSLNSNVHVHTPVKPATNVLSKNTRKSIDTAVANNIPKLQAINKQAAQKSFFKSIQTIVSSEKSFVEALTLTPRCVAEISIPDEALKILTILTTANSPQAHLSFVVGGLIRDSLLEVDTSQADIDIVTGIQANVLIPLFKDREMTILESGNYLQVSEGERKIDIWSSKELANPYYKNAKDALRADCKSRDFIINGLYANKDGKVFDPSNKALDNVLQGRVIDTVIDADISIQEDPLRILRAVYYSEKLTRPLSTNLQNAICKYQHLLLKDSPEHYIKLNANLGKLLIGKNAFQIFNHLASLRLLETLFSSHVCKVIQNDISIAALLKKAQVENWRIGKLLLNFILMSISSMDNIGSLMLKLQRGPDSIEKLESINHQLANIKNEALEYASHGCISQCLGTRFDKVFADALSHFTGAQYLLNAKERLEAMDLTQRHLPTPF